MRTVSSLVFHSARPTAELLAWVVVAWSVLVLLVFVAAAISGHSLPTPDDRSLAPLRWQEDVPA